MKIYIYIYVLVLFQETTAALELIGISSKVNQDGRIVHWEDT